VARGGVGLLLDETLEWNVAFPAMQIQNKFLKKYGPITWRDTKAIHDVTQKYIDELKIKCTSSKQKARELSGGNQQKVCLAKAFALQPRFLFVSEPTRGIDVGAKALVLDALKKFNRENGVTVVMISSELEELRTTCDRIAIVSGGRIVGILPATESSEPFGALDAQTRTQLQTELLETWEREKKTCFFITHDVEEAIILAQRVIIMSARPGRIKDIVDINIPYPRTQETKLTPEFNELKNHIWSQVYQEYLAVRK